MTRIRNYEELKLEKARLHQNLLVQKAALRHEMQVIKERVDPLLTAVSFLGIFKKKDNDSLLKMGVKTGVELLAHTTILSKAGWLSKLIVPMVLKGISSNVIDKIKSRRLARM
jgi:hypothetical protein